MMRNKLQQLPLTYAKDFWMFLGDASLSEKRDEGLIGSFDQHKLEWVTVEGNAFQRSNDCVKECSTSDL